MPTARLATIALAYMQQEQRVKALAAEVAASGIGSATAVEGLLLRGGVRAAVEEQLSRSDSRM